MKVFIALLLVIGSVAARGSGPYLPRGWKPDGPSFFLPSEVAKPAPSPVQVSLLQETEASGSDAFREYGPPKLEEVSVSVNQVLPEVATEQTFLAEVKNEETVVAVQETVNAEANAEQVAAVVEEVLTATEPQVAAVVQEVEELVTDVAEVQSTAASETLDVPDQAVETSEAVELEAVKEESIPTAAVEADIVPTAAIEAEIVPTAALAEVVVPTVIAEDVVVPLAQQELQEVVTAVTAEVVEEKAAEVVVEKVKEGVQNIAEALVNLEKEVKAAEVQAVENVAEITSVQEASGSLDAPEGFLEYGPPGFQEYGPPKQEDLARLAVEIASASALENNEVRRRRFSPKFRTSKKH